MKIKTLFIIPISIMLFMSTSSCHNVKKTDSEIEREKWIAGFTDSIEYYQEHSRQLQNRLDILNTKIAGLLEDFDLVKSAKEIKGFYILKGWNKKIPFTSTSIYARISESEKFEMIATLAGNTFNKISVGGFESETVPHDQAFNYRHERFNTVYFTGGKADTIADYISSHHMDKLSLAFLEGSKIRQNFIIPNDEKDMIAQTWDLYEAKKEAVTLEKEIWISSHKINTFRRLMEEEHVRQNTKK